MFLLNSFSRVWRYILLLLNIQHVPRIMRERDEREFCREREREREREKDVNKFNTSKWVKHHYHQNGTPPAVLYHISLRHTYYTHMTWHTVALSSDTTLTAAWIEGLRVGILPDVSWHSLNQICTDDVKWASFYGRTMRDLTQLMTWSTVSALPEWIHHHRQPSRASVSGCFSVWRNDATSFRVAWLKQRLMLLWATRSSSSHAFSSG